MTISDDVLTLLCVCADAASLLGGSQVKTYSCSEFTQKVPCSALSAPPPPANWTSKVCDVACGMPC
jgi:hypothetical protein